MRARTGPVILNGDPEFVKHGWIERQQIDRSTLAWIDVCTANIAIEIVHVQPCGRESESRRRGSIFNCLVQTERNDHSSRSGLANPKHSFAIVHVYKTVRGIGQFNQWIGGGR